MEGTADEISCETVSKNTIKMRARKGKKLRHWHSQLGIICSKDSINVKTVSLQ